MHPRENPGSANEKRAPAAPPYVGMGAPGSRMVNPALSVKQNKNSISSNQAMRILRLVGLSKISDKQVYV